MRLIIISLSALFMSLMLVISGNAYLLSLVGIRLGEMGTDPARIGLVMTAYSVGFVLGALLTPKLLLKVGHIRAFAALSSVTAMAAISYPILEIDWSWALLRLLGGFSVAGLFIAIESWFSAVASDNNRATLFSMYQVAAYLASASGQLLLDVSADAQVPMAFTLAGLLLMAAVIPLSISRMQSPPLESSARMSIIRLWKRAPVGMSGAFSGGLLIGGFYALTPVFGSLIELSRSEIAKLMFYSVLAAMVVAWPIGWLCDRVQRSQVLIGTLFLGTLGAVLITLLKSADLIWLSLASGLFMAAIAAIYSISVAITNDLIDSTERVSAASTLMLSYGIGSIAGPLAGSWLMQLFKPESVYLGFAITMVTLAVFTRYRQIQQPPLPVEAQEDFVPAMPEAQVNAEFDPRTEDLPDTPIEELFPSDDQVKSDEIDGSDPGGDTAEQMTEIQEASESNKQASADSPSSDQPVEGESPSAPKNPY